MSPVGILLLIVVILLLFGTGPWYPYSVNWGYAPVSTLGLLLIILIVLILAGKL